MTNLTFAELTALMAVNGLVINDRYFITDKNWTIIAITTNAYRVVVPIVTEVTLAQLDALVAANGLNEGLQYKVTDKNWLLIATGEALLKAFSGTIITANELLPAYIDTDIVIIDTGVITDNFQYFEIYRRDNFVFSDVFLDNQGDAFDNFSIVDDFAEFDITLIHPVEESAKYMGIIGGVLSPNGQSVPNSIKIYDGYYYICTAPNTSKTFRVKIKLKKVTI